MTNDEMRLEFEAAFAKETAGKFTREECQELEEFGDLEQVLRDAAFQDRIEDTYRIDIYAVGWWAWKASRAAVAVKLPVFDDYPASIDAEMRESLRRAIEGAGLKVTS